MKIRNFSIARPRNIHYVTVLILFFTLVFFRQFKGTCSSISLRSIKADLILQLRIIFSLYEFIIQASRQQSSRRHQRVRRMRGVVGQERWAYDMVQDTSQKFWMGVLKETNLGMARTPGGCSLILTIQVCAASSSRVFRPLWSENGYTLCPFSSGIGYGLRGNLVVYESIYRFNSK